MRRILASYLTAETFDSAALSGTAVVSHPLPKSGEWHALLTLGRSPLPVQNVLVLPDGGAAMVAIEPGAEAGQRLRAGGHVRLRAPDQSAGFAAQLRHASRETAAWNSKRLEEGDYFACLPLRPGRYRLVNRLSDSLAAVVVHYPDPRKQRKPEQLRTHARISESKLRGNSGFGIPP